MSCNYSKKYVRTKVFLFLAHKMYQIIYFNIRLSGRTICIWFSAWYVSRIGFWKKNFSSTTAKCEGEPVVSVVLGLWESSMRFKPRPLNLWLFIISCHSKFFVVSNIFSHTYRKWFSHLGDAGCLYLIYSQTCLKTGFCMLINFTWKILVFWMQKFHLSEFFDHLISIRVPVYLNL